MTDDRTDAWVSIWPLKVIFYRRGAALRWRRWGRWPMSSGTALDLGPIRVMTRRAFRGAIRLSDWFEAGHD